MKPLELLQYLDEFRGMTPDQVMTHPAWSYPVPWGGGMAMLKADGMRPAETVELDVAFEKSVCRLGLAPSPALPDFSKLFGVRDAVPPSILLAVVEKEAGPLFQTLENAVRKEFSVKGLAAADGEGDVAPWCFRLVDASGADVLTFTLSQTADVRGAFGNLVCLDCAHPSISECSLTGEIEFATFDLADEEVAGLAPGDHLLLPEMLDEKPGRVLLPGQEDAARCRVVASTPIRVLFSDVVEGTEAMRSPTVDDLTLVKGGCRLASGRLTKLGEQPAFAIETVFPQVQPQVSADEPHP